MGPFTQTAPGAPERTVAQIQEHLWNTTMEDSQSAMDVNVIGSFYTFVAFAHLLEAGNTHPESRGKKDFIQSQFITVTSLAAFSRTEKVSHIYQASKAALVHLTKILATQFGPLGIRANSIAPGMFITEMTEVCAPGLVIQDSG